MTRERMRVLTSVFLLVAVLEARAVSAQPPAVRLAMPASLREALERSGFDDAVRAENIPDLDRTLTSSAFGTSTDTFVAGYYFQDELYGQGLGPLHVSLFDRKRREWVHQPNVDRAVERLGMMAGGSVMSVGVWPTMVLLNTHFSPSAGFTVVLDRSLTVLTSLGGFGVHVANDGSMWYFGNMAHADTHQETLRTFDLGRRKE